MNEFKRILYSRNKILKLFRDRKLNEFNQIDIWDNLFAEKSSEILKRRIEFIKGYSQIFMKSYNKILNDNNPPDINYLMSSDSTDYKIIKDKLQKNRKRDIFTGTTNFGPQRDDYIISGNNRKFTNYASQGQRRAASISLKIAEYEILENLYKGKTILLVDDIFSELDNERKKNMLNIIREGNQVILTMVNIDSINLDDFKNYNLYHIKNGKII